MASSTVGDFPLPVDGKNLDIGGSQDLGQMIDALRSAVDGVFHPSTEPGDSGLSSPSIRVGGVSYIAILPTVGTPTVSATKGSIAINVSGSTVNNRVYVNTDGSTGWTSVTTAA